MKKLKRTLSIVILTITALLLATGCADLRNIRITSCEVESVSPVGFTSVDCVLNIGIHNPAMEFTVSGINGCVRKEDLRIVNFNGGPICVERKSDNVYSLPCKAALDAGITLFSAMSIIKSKDFSGYAVDITADITLKNGIKKTLTFNDISLQELLSKSPLGSTIQI